ncbi:NAD(P)-binding protein [Rhizodiscina lignyota]|uniref:NAD(P)-binding protein n=1 Tax=Rhizodiscina lignyota TaxID=1504668 RepID=A0A9P4IN94_9PEZI|nr:NAD(P)-binding protein [Rhizodiscina lignyota]
MALPKVQKAVFHDLKNNNLSIIYDSPVPAPDFRKRQHLVHVMTTSPCNNELTWPINYPHHMDADRIPIPCNDMAGVVVEAPEDSSFQPGTAVFCRTTAARTGDAREYTIAIESELAKKPDSLGWDEACAMPLSAETAWQCLFDKSGLAVPGSPHVDENKAKRVLITGASGSVGMWVVQLAKVAGVGQIVGLAGANSVGFVKSLGANEVVDYKAINLSTWGESEGGKNKVDLVFDCVGGKALGNCWSCVKEGGVLISVTDVPETFKPKDFVGNVTNFFFIMVSDGKQLEKIAELVEKGLCKPFVDSVWNFEQFQKAFDRVELKSGLKGKVIIKVEE